jgi:hypothetical protein
MGQMALGYGSEFHLLRWLGRHRNEFNKRVKELLNTTNITWLDFNFDKTQEIPDKELVGLEFLKNELNYEKILKIWKEEWPQTGNSMNWDLVGYTVQNNIRTWVLIEAKAHLGELKQDCGATSLVSIEKIKIALSETAKSNDVIINEKQPWTKQFYQFANRLYVLDFLKRNGINAKLINLYFVGDMISINRKSPKSKNEWQSKIKEMKDYLSVKTDNLKVYELFLDINK